MCGTATQVKLFCVFVNDLNSFVFTILYSTLDTMGWSLDWWCRGYCWRRTRTGQCIYVIIYGSRTKHMTPGSNKLQFQQKKKKEFFFSLDRNDTLSAGMMYLNSEKFDRMPKFLASRLVKVFLFNVMVGTWFIFSFIVSYFSWGFFNGTEGFF